MELDLSMSDSAKTLGDRQAGQKRASHLKIQGLNGI